MYTQQSPPTNWIAASSKTPVPSTSQTLNPTAVPDQPRIRLDSVLLSCDGFGYRCRFEGAYPVAKEMETPLGIAMVTDACHRMRQAKSRRRESGLNRAPLVELGLEVRSCEKRFAARTRLLGAPLRSMDFVAVDPEDRRYVLKQDVEISQAIPATMTQAFELATQAAVSSLECQLEIYPDRLPLTGCSVSGARSFVTVSCLSGH